MRAIFITALVIFGLLALIGIASGQGFMIAVGAGGFFISFLFFGADAGGA